MEPASRPGCPSSHRPSWRFDFTRGPSPGSRCLRHALVYGPLWHTALVTALIVGSILTIINQGNVILSGDIPLELYVKVPLTFCVPYCVATVSVLRVNYAGRVREPEAEAS